MGAGEGVYSAYRKKIVFGLDVPVNDSNGVNVGQSVKHLVRRKVKELEICGPDSIGRKLFSQESCRA